MRNTVIRLTAFVVLSFSQSVFAQQVVTPFNGGTGVSQANTKTITLGGALTTSGANALTLTTTGATNVTLPTTGTLLNTAGNAASATTATDFNNGTSSSSGGTVTATTFSGALSGNASTATTAGTVTTAAQPAITSVGTLTSVTSSGAISGTTGTFSGLVSLGTTGSGGELNALEALTTVAAGSQGRYIRLAYNSGSNYGGISLIGGLDSGGVPYGAIKHWNNATTGTEVVKILSTGLAVTGTTSSTAFSGPLTGNVTGNVSGTAATVTGAAQSAITSVGTLTGLSSSSYKDGAGNLIISSTAPTIASGFGTSPSITGNNTAAFQVTAGSGGTSYQGELTMPAATNGWACTAHELGVASSEIQQTATSGTDVQVANYNSTTGANYPWGVGSKILFQCTAF